MPLDSARIHNVPDDPLAAIDYCFEQGWTDGLPVVPPSLERVDDMLQYEGRPAETVIASHPATGYECTQEGTEEPSPCSKGYYCPGTFIDADTLVETF